MKPGVYRHIHTYDIDLEIIKAYPCSEGYKVRAALLNRHSGYVYEIKTFVIKNEQLKNWKLVD